MVFSHWSIWLECFISGPMGARINLREFSERVIWIQKNIGNIIKNGKTVIFSQVTIDSMICTSYFQFLGHLLLFFLAKMEIWRRDILRILAHKFCYNNFAIYLRCRNTYVNVLWGSQRFANPKANWSICVIKWYIISNWGKTNIWK